VKPTDDLVELRFHIPGTVGKGGSDDGSDDEEGAKEGGEEGASAAQAFHDMIKDRAEIGEGGGDSVVVFNEVLVLTPRFAIVSLSILFGSSLSKGGKLIRSGVL
jgi:structure-specific recognition protein 1